MPQLKIKDNGTWVDIPAGGVGVPSGGTTGQVLQKSSNTDYATEWATNDYYETGNSTITVNNSSGTEWVIPLHVPNDFTIVAVTIKYGNSGSILTGIEELTRSVISGYAMRFPGWSSTSVTITAYIHAVRTSALQIYS